MLIVGLSSSAFGTTVIPSPAVTPINVPTFGTSHVGGVPAAPPDVKTLLVVPDIGPVSYTHLTLPTNLRV